jgi:hypothetical protein
MQKKSIIKAITLALAVAAGSVAQGQPTNAYFKAVTNLNPVAYWPLNETAQPPAPLASGYVATNSGTLGAVGNGLYGAWYQTNGNSFFITNNIVQTNGVTSPLDGDKALWVTSPQGGQYVVVPHNRNGVPNPGVTIKAPFTVEAWCWPTGGTGGNNRMIVVQGQNNVNYSGPNTNEPFYGGLSPNGGWAGFALGQWTGNLYFNCYNTNVNNNKANELDSAANSFTNQQWYHIVATFDGTTKNLYLNNVLVGSKGTTANGAGLRYVPDQVSPLMIGSGDDVPNTYAVGFSGGLDEVAIYTNVLSTTSIANHYTAAFGTNSSFTSYPAAVMADNPILYYRLDEPAGQTNAGFPVNTYPVATNYGALGAAANGAYEPGTQPGVVGPSFVGFGSASTATAFNGEFGAVDVGGGGNLPAALNPNGTVPLTVISWFQGAPTDAEARYQEMVGHGSKGFELAMGTVGGDNEFNPGPGPQLQFATPASVATNSFALNDGSWHMAAGVSDGTNAYLYLDGALALSNSVATGINIASNSLDVLIGGDPQYTLDLGLNNGTEFRYWDGNLANVAIWTNALTAAQIQGLYNVAGVPANIRLQPVGTTNNGGAPVTVTATVGGSQPISYQWYENGSAVAGQTNQNLSYAAIPTNATGSFYLVASNMYGPPATSSVIQIYVFGAPTIVTQPTTSLEIFAGQNPVLSMSSAGAQPISYQWTSNNVVVSTNNVYTITNVKGGAIYVGTASNAFGTATTSPITLTIVPTPTAPYPAQVLADHPIAFWRLDESSGNVAYDYVGGNNGIYSNVSLAFAPPYNPNSDPTEGYAPGFGFLTTNDSYVGSVPTNISFSAPTNVNAEFSVECWAQESAVTSDNGLVAIGYGFGGEEFALDCGANDPAHDLRFYAVNAGGTSVGATSHVAPNDNKWHHIVGVCDEVSGHDYVYIDGTNAGTGNMSTSSGIRSLTAPLSIGARITGNGDNNYDNQFLGFIDEVAIYNYALSSNQVLTHYLASGIPASITQLNPVGNNGTLFLNVGSTTNLSVVAGGSTPLSYLWYNPNNALVSTNSTLVLSNVQSSAQGQYTITVSNAWGTVTAYEYVQVGSGPPQITQDLTPLMQTILLYSGVDNITYAIGVSGSGPFSYQWYQNGTKVSNATNSTYSFTATAGTNNYYVSVSNALSTGPVVSSTATVIGTVVPQLNTSNYPYKTKISFPGYNGQPLTNFPALITLSSTTVQGLAMSQFSTNGSDVRFTDASGTGLLASEVDEWNVGGVSTVWVLIPLLNGSNIYAYWGDLTPTNQPPASSNVWINSGYEIVYHLKESAPPYADSTGQYPATNLTNGTPPLQTNGVIGHGLALNGTSQAISPGAVTLSNQFTTYTWAYLSPSAAAQIQTLWCNQPGGYGNSGFAEFINAYNTSDHGILIANGDNVSQKYQQEFTGAFSPGQWHLLAVSYDQQAAVFNCFLDGSSVGSGGCANDFPLTNNLNLGAFLDPTFWWTGNVDEARIQYGIASTNWMQTTYQNMSSSSYVSYSALNSAPFLSITATTSGYILSWPTNDGSFTLETATNLLQTVSSPSAWKSAGTPVVVNGVNQLTVPTNSGSSFYRLQGAGQ